MRKHLKFYFSKLLLFNKNYFLVYCFISSLAAVVQTFGLISVFPLVAVFMTPETFLQNEYFIRFYPFIYSDERQLMVQLSIFFVIFNLIALLIFMSSIVFGKFVAESTTIKIKIQIFKKYSHQITFCLQSEVNCLISLIMNWEKCPSHLSTLLICFRMH